MKEKYIEKFLELKKKPIFEDNRSFSDRNLGVAIFQYIKKLHINDENKLKIALKNNIVNFLINKGIKKGEKINLIVLPNGYLKINTKTNTYTFNLNHSLKDFEKNPNLDIFLGDEKKLNQEKLNQNKEIIKLFEETSNILDAMDYVFRKNEKEWFDELNDDDIVDTDQFGKKYVGLNLKQLQKLFKEKFDKLNSYPKENLNAKEIKILYYQERRYFKMVMGIGDTYEGGAAYLKEDKDNFRKLADDIVNYTGDHTDLLYLLKNFHQEIDDNDYQSTTVERSYKITIEELHKKIYNKLMKEKASDKDLVLFAKIITGKDGFDIDDNLRDPILAQTILMSIFQRKDGIMDKLEENGHLNIEDKEVSDKNPKAIIDDVRKRFYKKYGKNLQVENLFNKNLKNAGYGDILDIDPKLSYSDLSFYQKTKLSVLYRVGNKMEEGKTSWEMTKQGFGKALDLSNPIVNQQYVLQDFVGLFNLVAEDYITETAEKMEETFSENESFWESITFGKDAESMGLKGVQAEAFDLFQDINGAGLLGISDENLSRLKEIGKFVGVMAIAMAVPMIALPTAGLIAQGAAAGAAASVAGWAINPHGYDTINEAALDLSSDLIVGTVTGAGGGILANKAAGYTGKNMFYKFARNDKTIMAADLTFLGLVPEVARMKWINGKFHNGELLTDSEKIIGQIK